MARGAQPFPLTLRIRAPIWDRGSMIRFMGRVFREASPERREGKSCPARMPETSLVVVPLFPVSNTIDAAGSCCPFSPLSPLP